MACHSSELKAAQRAVFPRKLCVVPRSPVLPPPRSTFILCLDINELYEKKLLEAQKGYERHSWPRDEEIETACRGGAHSRCWCRFSFLLFSVWTSCVFTHGCDCCRQVRVGDVPARPPAEPAEPKGHPRSVRGRLGHVQDVLFGPRGWVLLCVCVCV